MKIKNNKALIKTMLIEKPHLREDDRKLIATVWYKEVKDLNTPVIDFLHHFADNKITHPESIRRCRAKLQETCPELRGNNYHKRKGTSVRFVNEQLRNF